MLALPVAWMLSMVAWVRCWVGGHVGVGLAEDAGLGWPLPRWRGGFELLLVLLAVGLLPTAGSC